MKGMKIWDGWKVEYNGKATDLSCPPDVWKWFKDTLGIELTEEQKTNITRVMYCFGHQEIKLTNGKCIVLDVIPVKDGE